MGEESTALHLRKIWLAIASLMVLTALWTALLAMAGTEAQGTLLLAMSSQLLVVVLLFLKKDREPFEPFVWFSAMYFLLPSMAAYMVATNFWELYHWNIAFRSDRFVLMNNALVVSLFGYLAYWLGDSAGDRRAVASRPKVARLPVASHSLIWVVVLCYGIGFANFVVNAWLYDSLDLTALLLDFGARDHRFQHLPPYYSTVGYNFLTVALVLHLHVNLREEGKVDLLYLLLASAVAIVMLSTGRVWYTFSIGLALFGTWYLINSKPKLAKATLGIATFVLMVLLAFVFRIVSNLLYIESGGGQGWLILLKETVGNLGYLIFGRSNVPSLPILAEVVSTYGQARPYLLGDTLSYWLTYLVPGMEVKFLGHTLKDEFYPAWPGGFPPTVFGELYANAGVPAVLIGCFCLGLAARCLYRLALSAGSFLLIFVYMALLFRFIFMLPKLETASLGSALWLAAPIALVWLSLLGIAKLVRRGSESFPLPATGEK